MTPDHFLGMLVGLPLGFLIAYLAREAYRLARDFFRFLGIIIEIKEFADDSAGGFIIEVQVAPRKEK